MRDEASIIYIATQKGIEQGRGEGRKNMFSTAKKLLEMGMAIDDVVKATNLTKEEILKLK